MPQAQQQKLERTEAAQQRAHGRLLKMQQQLHSHGGGSLDDEVSGTQLLEVLREDVARVRLQVSVQWPRELEAKQGRLAAVHATLNNGINTEVGACARAPQRPPTGGCVCPADTRVPAACTLPPRLRVQGDLQRLLAQEGDLQQQVAAAQERLASVQRARAADRAFLPVRQAQQMANLVARKKGELAAKVARLQERQAALSGSVANSPMDGSGGAGGAGGAVSEDAWRAKFEAVKAQLPTYKAMKQELAELEAEVRGCGCARLPQGCACTHRVCTATARVLPLRWSPATRYTCCSRQRRSCGSRTPRALP
jgi:intraflagellar transport protein 81